MAGYNISGRIRSLLAATMCLIGMSSFLLGRPAEALVYTYENSTAGTLSAATPCANPLVRTFTVSDAFTVSGIAVGLNITHPNRGDVRATLVAPGGSSFVFVASSGDADDNYDILVSTNNEGGIDDNDIDPVAEPFFNRPVFNTGMNFYTGNASGTWTLQICDNVPASNNGTYNRSRLILTSAEAAVTSCTSSVTYDWGANGNDAAFTSVTLSGMTFSQTSAVNYGSSAATPNFATRTTTQGNHTGYYITTMDAPTGTQSEDIGNVIVFTFSPPVRDLRFSALDVDWQGGNSWEDLFAVMPRDDAGNVVPYSVTTHSANQMAGNTGEGDASAATTSANGNLDYVIPGAVTTLTFEYSQADEPTVSAVFQVVGISDFGSFCAFDYGDAPNTYGTQLSGGARHVIGNRDLYLGANPPDGETNGQPGAAASTDDTTQVGGINDEDGVASFPAYSGGSSTYTVSVTAVNRSTTTAASLVGYIDWNRDGDFTDANERSATTSVPASTTSPSAFNVTWTAVPVNAGGTTATYARFRIAYVAAEVTTSIGEANSGEVEDYPIAVNTLPVTLASFAATQEGGGTVVRWSTETATSTLGFRVHGWNGKGWDLLSEKLLPAATLDSLAPESYEFAVEGQGYSSFALEDVDLEGKSTWHGPFAPGEAYGREPEPKSIDWQAAQAELEEQEQLEVSRRAEQNRGKTSLATLAASGKVLAELALDARGFYRVTYEDLLAAGIDLLGYPVGKLSLKEARGGKSIALLVVPSAASAQTFGPGGYLEFLGSPVEGSLYTRTRRYSLIASAPFRRVKVRDGSPGEGVTLPSYKAEATVEKDLVYSIASPNGDPFFEAPILAQSGVTERDFAIAVDALAGGQATLHVDLWGVTNWPGEALDHHIELWLNGSFLAEEHFDGLVSRSYDLPLPAGLLLEGQNRLRVRVMGDTGFAFDLVHVDGYGIRYPRRFEARGGSLSFPASAGTMEVDGLPSPDVTVALQSGELRLSGVMVEPSPLGYRARFRVPAPGFEGSVEVVAAGAFLRPQVSLPRPAATGLLSPGRRGSDYLILSHPLFLADLAELVAAREAEGYGVKVVDVLDVYQAYSGGEVDPQAIRSYLKAASQKLGTRMVLLVGGDSYDYLNHLGLGSISLLPTIYAQTDELIHFTPADPLLVDFDGDGIQDLAIGRLPARSRAELQRLIDKTLRYPAVAASAVFSAGGSAEGLYSAISEDIAGTLPGAWPIVRAYIDKLGAAGARSSLLSAFDAGPALVNYVGHSGPTVWSFEGLFAAADSTLLRNSSAPAMVVQWGCWNTYHVSPQYDTMAHRLLLEGSQGAAAVVGSSTLTRESSDARLGPELIRRLVGSGKTPGLTVGEAILAAKKAIAADGSGGGDVRDVLLGWTLLGDPALRLPLR